MMPAMIISNNGGTVSPSDRGSGVAEEENTTASISAGNSGFSIAARGGIDGSEEMRISDSVRDSRVLKLEKEENASVPRMLVNSKNSDSRSEKLDYKKNSTVEDYNSILSAFDDFAAREKDEAVGNGFKIGDMVWGKVKSHPWWPGFIHNEAFASASVRRGRHEGHVLVAFFGDSSYGWFDPAELIPFEENFAEKSQQTMSRTFLKAVEEAIDELSRRSSMGLACRCRNQSNFSPSKVEGHYVVYVEDYDPGVYGLSQLRKARDSFRTREMLSFIREMALEPRNDQHLSIDFIKNTAIAVAYRKAQFEEFDETYAQAFGYTPVHPPRPSAQVAVDPSKAPLSGRLVVAEALGQGKVSVKPAKTKDQVEKDKYLFKRRDESIQIKSKKASVSQASHTSHPNTVDGHHSGIAYPAATESGIADKQHQLIATVTKPSDGSRKFIESRTKKLKVRKRPEGELIAENATSLKKKKNGASTEAGVKRRELPLAVGNSNSTEASENVSGIPLNVQLIDNEGLEKKDTESSLLEQEADFVKIELQMILNDLRALALNPFHGEQSSCPSVIKDVFLIYRSLVYQKSLVFTPLPESEEIESNSSRLPAEKPNDKIVKPTVRLDDPTKGGKKRSPPDRPEDVKRKKLDPVKRKRLDDSLDAKKKKINNPKPLTAERKILQTPTEQPEVRPNAVKLEPSKRTGPVAKGAARPTMLIMKFPAGAALPSGYELKAKFARFGPLDQSATRIFWKTDTCRLVYQHRIDAQAALKFSVGSRILFGNRDVKCFLKEMEAEGAESEAKKEEVRESVVEQNRIASAQLKSCLKKPAGNEGGVRGARVKFVLRGEKEEINENKKNNDASFRQGDFSSINSLDLTSKVLPAKLNPQSRTSSFKKLPSTVPFEKESRPSNSIKNKDISQQMFNLLTRCNDVVNNLRGSLGYMPYHPL